MDRLQRLREELEASELGAVLAFDFTNIRYMTATDIGTWAVDKLIRFALLVRGGDKFPAEELLVAGQRYFAVGGQLPTLREPQSHRNRPRD
ncbi:hypothetical protein ACWGQ5_49970 [Streptomyces sp. NPDC055722]